MLIKDVMTCDVWTCPPEATVGGAARIMSARECGIVPVVDGRRKLAGVVTDRDVCLAIASRARNPVELPIADVMTRTVYTCSVTDDVEAALQVMKRQRVRRLPVVDADRRLVGLLSIDDLVARTAATPEDGILAEALLDTLRTLATHTVSM